MKSHIGKFLCTLLFIATTGMLLAQSSETRQLSSFSEVKVSEGIQAKLRKGDKNQVKVEVENIDIDMVKTEIRGNQLKIHIDDSYKKSRKAEIKVYLTFTELQGIDASSGAYVILEDAVSAESFELESSSGAHIKVEANLKAKNMNVDVSSGSHITVESIDADEMQADASSGASITIEGGSANRLTVDVSSSGKLDAYELECKHVKADGSSGGGVKIHASESLEGNCSSGSWVYYKGSPDKVRERSSSGGRVRAQ